MRALLAAALAACLAACGADDRARRPDVLLVSIDTLRADALSCYGNPRPTSPVLDALAARGIRFEQVLAQAPNTATSHASLFTGLLPWAHRVANISSLEHGTPALHPAFTTLAEHFSAAGYQTIAVTDDGPLGAAWDLLQGFETTDARYTPIEETVDAALELIADRDPDRPLFLFVHTYEVHEPYLPPPALVERFGGDYDGPLRAVVAAARAEQARVGATPSWGRLLREVGELAPPDVDFLRDLYEAGVAHADAALAPLFEALGPEALIAVTSDHGEEFGEHGVFGHKQLHAETLHVPLLLRLPGAALAGTTVAPRVSQIDLHGTLLAAVGLRPEPGANSTDLVAVARGAARAGAASVASTNEHLHPATATQPFLRAIRTDAATWLESAADGGRGPLSVGLYAPADGAERVPLYAGPVEGLPEELAARAAAARATLEGRLAEAGRSFERRLRDAPPAPTVRGSADAVEALRNLGYLDD